MSIQITFEIEQLVQSIFANGNYRSETEVLDEALHLLRDRQELRRAVNDGIEELDRGQRTPASEVFARVEQKIREVGRQAS
jgi:predicted transcriptional regulator